MLSLKELLSPAKHFNIGDDDLDNVLRAAFQAADDPIFELEFRALG